MPPPFLSVALTSSSSSSPFGKLPSIAKPSSTFATLRDDNEDDDDDNNNDDDDDEDEDHDSTPMPWRSSNSVNRHAAVMRR